ncbi:MAG TPA: efflux RND transporter periplasmic adaptor subunit [Chthonomonadaceae bacterium]|nr:efflux RND transporter periplasmic adaptor subunit [Chthonomonadaceae bacterium]
MTTSPEPEIASPPSETPAPPQAVRRAHPRSKLLIAGLVLLLLLIAFGGWAYYATRPYPAAVTQRDIVATITLSGAAVAPPSAQAILLPPYHAPVDKVLSSVGAHVRRGDVLVRLALSSVQEAYRQARQNEKDAETAYANAARQYEDSIRAARKQLADARRAAVAARQTASPPATSSDTNAPPSDEPSSTDQSTTDQTTTTDLATGTDPSQAMAQVQAAQQTLQQAIADRDAGLAPYRQQLDAARQALADARSGERLALIRAPISGTVLELNAVPGQSIGSDAKTPVAVIVNLKDLQVQASMDAKQGANVKPGLPAALAFAGLPDQNYAGTVGRLTTQMVTKAGGLIKEQRYVALIDFDNDQKRVKPGAAATVSIKLGAAKHVLAVPNDAVQTDAAGRTFVKALRNGQWQVVYVQAGLSDGQFTQIKSGLKKDETIEVQPKLGEKLKLP